MSAFRKLALATFLLVFYALPVRAQYIGGSGTYRYGSVYGGGTLFLSANTFTGATTINSGTLAVAYPSGLVGDGVAMVNTLSSGTAVLNGSITYNGAATGGVLILGSGTLQVGNGTFTLSGANTYTGGLTANSGTIRFVSDHSSTIQVTAGAVMSLGSLISNGGTLNGGGVINNTPRPLNRPFPLNPSSALSNPNSIGGRLQAPYSSPALITTAGAGPHAWNGANAYFVGTLVGSGTLTVQNWSNSDLNNRFIAGDVTFGAGTFNLHSLSTPATTLTVVPEPASVVLFGCGLAALSAAAVRRRFRRQESCDRSR